MEVTVKCSWAHLFLMRCCLNIDFWPCTQRFLQIRAIAVDDESFKVFLFLHPVMSLTCCQLTWLAAVFLQLVLFSAVFILPFVALLLRHVAAIKCKMTLIFFLKMVIRFINHYILSLLYTASQLFVLLSPTILWTYTYKKDACRFFSKCILICQYHRVKLYDIRGLHISSRWGL